MSIDNNIIPLEALFAADSFDPNPECDPREMLHVADVVLGVDVMSQREFLVFGKKALERIVTTGVTEELAVVKIGVDQETDELEKLLALMTVVKGNHDYQSGTGP